MPSSQDLLPSDLTNPRTAAALQRLRQAMAEIEAEIAQHHGVYPYNHGRVTQSELCRRADVKKATLQTPLHKDSTRVQVLQWLEGISAGLATQRDGTRQRVTAAADQLAAELAECNAALQATLLELGLAEQRLEALEIDNAELRRQLPTRP
jgi:hypothetical protein